MLHWESYHVVCLRSRVSCCQLFVRRVVRAAPLARAKSNSETQTPYAVTQDSLIRPYFDFDSYVEMRSRSVFGFVTVLFTLSLVLACVLLLLIVLPVVGD